MVIFEWVLFFVKKKKISTLLIIFSASCFSLCLSSVASLGPVLAESLFIFFFYSVVFLFFTAFFNSYSFSLFLQPSLFWFACFYFLTWEQLWFLVHNSLRYFSYFFLLISGFQHHPHYLTFPEMFLISRWKSTFPSFILSGYIFLSRNNSFVFFFYHIGWFIVEKI